MRSTVNGKRSTHTFDSVGDLVSATMDCPDAVMMGNMGMASDPSWYGGVHSMAKLAALAKEGLSAEGIEAYKIAEEKVAILDRELPLPGFATYYDVSGADVDVAAFLSGEPECMINYEMVETPKVGRVITLVVSTSVPWTVSADAIRERGREVVSLIFAIERMGFQVELWADHLSSQSPSPGPRHVSLRTRVCVKEPGGLLDTSEIMFAFTHPGMVRGMILESKWLFPAKLRTAMSVCSGGNYGYPVSAPDLDEYPEGSILIPPLMNSRGSATLVADTLRKLELVD